MTAPWRELLLAVARGLDRCSAALWRAAVIAPDRAEPDYERRFRMTLREWLDYHSRDVVLSRCRWLGTPAQKNPLDAWICQELVHAVRPEVLIEIGGNEGGSTLFFAHLFDLLGAGQVVSVEIDRSRFAVEHPRIVEVTGDSSAPETVARVAALVGDRSALVVHDGNHAKDAVLADLRLYSPFVRPGGYLIVEDGLVDLMPPRDVYGRLPEGPRAAVREFLKENRDFEIDAACERYLLTYNPGGYLRRVR